MDRVRVRIRLGLGLWVATSDVASVALGRLRNRRAAQDVAEYLDVARRPADVAPDTSGVLSNPNPTLTLTLTLTL